MKKLINLSFLNILLLILICSCHKSDQNKTIKTSSMLNEQINTSEISVIPEKNIICSNELYHFNEELENNNHATEYDWTNNIKEFEAINGTWVYHEDLLSSFLISSYNYSWGTGRTIPHSSMDFDLGEKIIYLVGDGRYIIDRIYTKENGAICLYFFPSSKNEPFIIENLEIKFIDNNKAYISSQSNIGQIIKTLSPENPWIWHRLSGPGY